jgi:hypothetical protein
MILIDISSALSYINFIRTHIGTAPKKTGNTKMSRVDCKEHSKSMELLALRIRLEKGIPDPRELEEVKKKIARLEKELELD